MNKKNRTETPDRIHTGITGFDLLTGGGLPAGRTTLVLGGPGSGKTVFALQTLVAGAREGEAGIFVSFGQRPRQVVEDGKSFGWDLAELERRHLVFLDAGMRPGMVKAGQYDLTGMLAGLQAVAAETGSRRVVFDSFDILLALLDDRLAGLQEAFRLRDWLYENRFTAIITANADDRDPNSVQHRAILQFIADCAVGLEVRSGVLAAMRYLRVLKCRGSAFVEQEQPFGIGSSGIELRPAASVGRDLGNAEILRPEIARARRQLTARVQALDRFLEMKQAELGFLEERKAGRTAGTGSRSRQPGVSMQRA